MFTGNLYITLDGDYAVKRVDMGVDGRINVNFIRGVRVTQDYEKVPGRGWMMKRDYLLVDFYAGYDLPGVLGERLQVFENRELPRIEVADSLFEHLDEREREAVEKAMKAGQGKLTAELTGGMPETREKGLHDGDSAFWRSERLEALSETQERTYELMDSVQKVPMMRRMGQRLQRGHQRRRPQLPQHPADRPDPDTHRLLLLQDHTAEHCNQQRRYRPRYASVQDVGTHPQLCRVRT